MKSYVLKSQTDLSGFYIVYKGSALTESDSDRGLNHLVEHLVCRTIQKLIIEFHNYAVYFNAITSDNYIVYYITGINKYINRYKAILFEEITSFRLFNEEILQQEKKIILEEYKMIFSNRFHAYRYNVFRKYFNYYSAIGDYDTIANSTLNQVQELYNRQYKEPFMVIDVSRRSTLTFPESDCCDYLVDRSNKLTFSANKVYKKENMPLIKGRKVQIIMNKKLIPDSELPKTQFINYMLCGGIQKPLYKKLRIENGLCYHAEMKDYCFDNQHSILFSTETENKNTEQMQKIFASVIDNPKTFLNKESFNQTLVYLKLQKKIQAANRYSNVTDLFYNSIYKNSYLFELKFNDILEHFEKYYLNFDENFLLTTL